MSQSVPNVILVDTSAWIEFLRDTGSPICNRVDALLALEIAVCEPVRMEILAGARDEQHLRGLERLLARAATLRTMPADYDEAAAVYRRCRLGGETVRKLIDCLIAAVAMRAGAAILHNDRDFDVIARHAELEIDTAGSGSA